MKKTIELNEQEANLLIQLLDTASKARGLEVAQACLHFHNLIKEAFKQEQDTEEDGTE